MDKGIAQAFGIPRELLRPGSAYEHLPMHGLSREQSAPDESSKAVIKEREKTFAAFLEAGLKVNAEMRRSWKRAFTKAQAKEHRALRGKYVHAHKGRKPKLGIPHRRK